MSNFPEYYSKPPCGMYDNTPAFATTPSFAFNNSDVGFMPKPQYQPYNSQNSATDNPSVTGSIYTEAQWGGAHPDMFAFQPLDSATIEDYEVNNLCRSERIYGGVMVPFVFSGMLNYSNFGPGALEPSDWSKQTPLSRPVIG